MEYKLLRGVDLTDELLNKYSQEGYSLFDVEKHMGVYNVILQRGGGDTGGGGASIENVNSIDSSLEINDGVLGVNINKNDSNVDMDKTSNGLSSNFYWKDYQNEQQ